MTIAENSTQSVDEFKTCLYDMQNVRKQLTKLILSAQDVDQKYFEVIERTLYELCDSRTNGEIRKIASHGSTFSINIQDEIRGLKKDDEFLKKYLQVEDHRWELIDVPEILSRYFARGVEEFYNEMEMCEKFLRKLIETESTDGVLPLFITDWDGTMKDYCSQYATNVQPVYSAVAMGHFARQFTRAFAVLTAGPLRRPGILDLTALPIDGPVLFSGSWGREWWLRGKRVVHEDGIPEEGSVAIGQLYEQMDEVIHEGDFVQFALVGSGIQKKVDRLTLGVQTVFGQVPRDLSSRYIEAVKERIHRVDPSNQFLVLENCSPLEIEVCVHSSGTVWNKGDGVSSLVESLGDSLKNGKVCVAGDTPSDLPMLKRAMDENPENTFALFVDARENLKSMVAQIVPDESRVCFVSNPDVIHAAFAKIIKEAAQQ
ncbi:unnamed protein product [Caenorhabditis bovis]|uniref:Trehalose-6-phosphate phosphatase helical bundle domain-containing protein n=1 Tax=Caenorhabditis bovis TaxID=2654633 RepID=A0A8S1FD35_9PELO|nr:unnamed protein product [Caenorhabditis bovis]